MDHLKFYWTSTYGTEILPQNVSYVTISVLSIFAVVGIALILIAVVLAFVVMIRNHKQRTSPLTKTHKGEPSSNLIVNPIYSKTEFIHLEISEAIKDNTINIRQLGQGNFGTAFYAKTKNEGEDAK